MTRTLPKKCDVFKWLSYENTRNQEKNKKEQRKKPGKLDVVNKYAPWLYIKLVVDVFQK